jgi:hypothetical protein
MDTQLSHLFDQRQAAQFLGLCPRTLASWRLTGGGPVYIPASCFSCGHVSAASGSVRYVSCAGSLISSGEYDPR